MSLLGARTYEASGGASELRSYDGGETVLIEAQEEGFVAAWTADVDARRFLGVVCELVPASAEAALTPSIGGLTKASLDDASAAVQAGPGSMRFIAVTAGEDNVMWSAVNPGSPLGGPDAPGQVAFAYSAFDADRIARLIEATATDRVRSDLPRILASAERLTHPAPPTAA